MKNRFITLVLFTILSYSAHAGITTYSFVSKDWISQVNATTCDGVADGWVCDKEAYSYAEGYTDAQGRIYGRGVSVKTGTTGAGATSVVHFENVRIIDINFCQNTSKGKGSIYVQIGDNTAHELVINRPAKGQGQYNRDTTIQVTTPESGKIRFWVECTENAININTISIRSSNSGSSPFTTDTYQLVTHIDQLQDSDQIIIGVYHPNVTKIMGYFNEEVSVNNIHAIEGEYSDDRMQLTANNDAIYTLHRGELDGEVAFYIEDNIRYESAYLVASGGKTKNRLALWDKLYDSGTYGNYGYWDISIANTGEATIMNLGNSIGKYLQYNASNNPPLFSCYAELNQTPVCIYRRVEALGDTMAIIAPLTNFGTVLLDHTVCTGERNITINANRLTEDINASLKHNQHFQLSSNTIDRDGGQLTISYSISENGYYLDTLVLQSGDVRCEATVMLRAVAPMTIAQASQSTDHETIYLDSVVVTKKYDSYIFIRDTTGSMLIYDTGDGTGHRYGSGLQQGHVLRHVVGRFRNYYGVPELSPTQAWEIEKDKVECPPVSINQLDSSDVCAYIRIADAAISEESLLSSATISGVSIADKFDMGMQYGSFRYVDAIVMIVWNEVQLWCVAQERQTSDVPAIAAPNMLGVKMLHNGQLIINHNGVYYTILGEKYPL